MLTAWQICRVVALFMDKMLVSSTGVGIGYHQKTIVRVVAVVMKSIDTINIR